MKILFNVGRFSGGAPLSILEYAKIAKDEGIEVLAIGEYHNCQEKYKDYGIKTYNVPYFALRRVYRNVNSLWKYYQIIKHEKPNLIHATSYGIIPSKFITKLCGINIMYSIAGGKASARNFDNEELIVYSEENKEDLIKEGYLPERIEVISNRMNIDSKSNNYEMHYNLKPNEIKLLLISRLDHGLIQSILNVIEIASTLSKDYSNLTLDIIGSGKFQDVVEEKAHEINKIATRKIIRVHGYQKDVKKFIDDAHIVFGKGRSIIEAVLRNRISFVVGEDKLIAECTPITVSNLYKYNFSGRNIEKKSSIRDIVDIVETINHANYPIAKLEKTRKLVDELYNIQHAKKQIVELYGDKMNGTDSDNRNGGMLSAICFLLRVYFNGLVKFVRN